MSGNAKQARVASQLLLDDENQKLSKVLPAQDDTIKIIRLPHGGIRVTTRNE